MKRWFATFVAACSLYAGPVLAGSPDEAKIFVNSVAANVLEVIKTDKTEREKLAALEVIFADAVDIPYVGKFVLGRHWRSASAAQRTAYLAAYQPFVIKNYAGKLTRYSGQNYTLENARATGDDYTVTMEILDPGNPSVFVDYRLREHAGSYKVVDIVVEGVSLVATQRSEFNSIVTRKGIDYLIGALEKQVNRA